MRFIYKERNRKEKYYNTIILLLFDIYTQGTLSMYYFDASNLYFKRNIEFFSQIFFFFFFLWNDSVYVCENKKITIHFFLFIKWVFFKSIIIMFSFHLYLVNGIKFHILYLIWKRKLMINNFIYISKSFIFRLKEFYIHQIIITFFDDWWPVGFANTKKFFFKYCHNCNFDVN